MRHTKIELDADIVINGKTFFFTLYVSGMVGPDEVMDAVVMNTDRVSDLFDADDFADELLQQYHIDEIDRIYDKAKAERNRE